jgi:vacuolar-type H+-ATPase catalytic subunit A/Vma1
MSAQEQFQKVDFIRGSFTPSEMRELISSFIDKSINLYKIQYMSQWEANHKHKIETLNNKIEELTNKKKKLLKVVEKAGLEGARVSLDSILELKLVK